MRKSLPGGQDERRARLAEGTAWAAAQRHERMRCLWGVVGRVAFAALLSTDDKHQRRMI